MIGLLFNSYSIEFILGAFSALLVSSERILKLPLALFLFIIGCILLSMPYLFFRFYSINPSGVFIQAIVFGIVFSLLVMACVVIEKKTAIQFPAFLVQVGNVSYTIYLSHVLILGVLGRLWAAYFQKPFIVWDNLFIMLLMLSAIIIYSMIAYPLIERSSYNFLVKRFSSGKKIAAIIL